MGIDVIQNRLLSYQNQTILEQEHALKEIAQEIALLALARADFFRVAAFQGGTCLRILYGLERFLRARESTALDLWSKAFFLSRAEKLNRYLNELH